MFSARNIIILMFFFVQTQLIAQVKEHFFAVTFKGDKIGSLNVTEKVIGKKSIKNLTVKTELAYVLITINTECTISTTHINGMLINGNAYRNASHGLEDVHSSVLRKGPKLYQKERNGVKETISGIHITFCVLDLYFKEPKGVTKLFSNMYGQMLTLKKVGVGYYQLITPDNQDAFYTYKNGQLVSIKVGTKLGDVITQRN